jgi:cysteinyl-tRNA synthetase
MSLRLYNTLTRQIEPFVPLQPGRVTLYTCGPTVYHYAHIGNFRTFLFEDLLRRWLEASGYDVYHVMNLTDVDDKTIGGAVAAGQPLRTYVQRYIDAFHEDRRYLRIKDASVYPRATDFIAPMIALVEALLAKGIAYRGEDGSVYFAIARFPAYGKLSQVERRELKAGASERVSDDEYAKEDVRDFALWKAARADDEAVGAAWDAPFGRGRPGWHLECSAMALDLVRRHAGVDVLDIHAGGVDLIFPHHEDEIAQSCAYTGEALFARYWVHGEFLRIGGEKMSKRYGNITTARDLREDGVDAGAVRLLMCQVHYRQQLDLTDQALASAREGSRRLGEFQNRLLAAAGAADGRVFVEAAARLDQELAAALDDDLNAPRAAAALFSFASAGNAALDAGQPAGPGAVAAWRRAEGVLGVTSSVESLKVGTAVDVAAGHAELPAEAPSGDEEAQRSWAIRWAVRRKDAKAARDFAEADGIRARLKAAGWDVRDNRDGSIDVVRAGAR